MKIIEPPHYYFGAEPSLFLAGGITGCPDWQQELITLLGDVPLVIFNPRRTHFPIEDPNAAREQIKWEYIHLRKATAISFWFPCETLCPIVLYELGAWSMTNKPLFIGVHPNYQRLQDVQIQTTLARPDSAMTYSLEALAQNIRIWAQEEKVEVFTIIVNGRKNVVATEEVSFDQVVRLAFDTTTFLCRVTYRLGPEANPEGMLLKDGTVKLTDGMNDRLCGAFNEGEEPCGKPGVERTLSNWIESDQGPRLIACDDHWQMISKQLDTFRDIAQKYPRLAENLLYPRISWDERKRQEKELEL